MRINFILLFVLSQSIAFAQGSVEARPAEFDSPKDYFFDKAKYLEYIEQNYEVKPNKAWLVISDRANNRTFKKPKEGAAQKDVMKFLDYGYVKEVSSDGKWINVIDAKVSGTKVIDEIKDYGWIKKEKMLLWQSGLVSPATQIHRKAFLLNKVNDIETIIKQKGEIAKVYDSPVKSGSLGKKELYQFYYVLKKENRRVLLSEEVEIKSKTHVKRHIIGWVREDKVTEWNTRIAVEPNFSIGGFNERKQNEELRLVGFENRTGAADHAEVGIIDDAQVYWDNDPIKIKSEQLGKSNPRRFKGGVVRFPFLSTSETSVQSSANQKPYFRSGVIGHVNLSGDKAGRKTGQGAEDVLESFKKEFIKKIQAKAKNTNILLIVEASQFADAHKSKIVAAVESLVNKIKKQSDKNIKIGLVLYRDFPERKYGKLSKVFEFSSDYNSILNSLRNAEFNNWEERDQYTALHYAIKSGIEDAGFSDEQSNIVINIGMFGDYRGDTERRNSAKASGESTFIKTKELIQTLANVNAHYYSIQLDHLDNRASEWFKKHNRYFLIESSKIYYNEYSSSDFLKDTDFSKKGPEVGDLTNQEGLLRINRSAVPGFLFYPSSGKEIEGKKLSEVLLEAYTLSINHNEKLAKVFTDIDVDGLDIERVLEEGNFSKIGAGELSEAVILQLQRMIAEMKSSGFSEGELDNVVIPKLRLFTEVYFPKSIPDAQHPPISYILYMPEKDLEYYSELLGKCVIAEDLPYNEKRKALYGAMRGIIKQFAGDMKREDIDKVSSEEFFAYLQGVKGEGLELTDVQEFKIKDILDDRGMTDKEVDKFIERIKSKEELLYNIRRNPNYEFSYISGDIKYFWIPVEDAF